MEKRQLNYEIRIQLDNPNDYLIVRPPFTVEFNIQRQLYASASRCSVKIYNLSLDNRRKIQKDQSDYTNLTKEFVFKAGYGNNLSTLFKGNITFARSYRQDVDFITSIECMTGMNAAVNSFYSGNFKEGTSNKKIIEEIMTSMYGEGVRIGKIGNFEGEIKRSNAYAGNPVDLLRDMIGNNFFIDNDLAYALNEDEVLGVDAFLVSPETGLIGTPIREQEQVTFDMLFEPQISVGRLIKLESESQEKYNSRYKVYAVTHSGMISDSVAGDTITTVSVLFRNGFRSL